MTSTNSIRTLECSPLSSLGLVHARLDHTLPNCIFCRQCFILRTLLVGLGTGRLEDTPYSWELRESIIPQFIGLISSS